MNSINKPLTIADKAAPLPDCFNAQNPATYKQAIDERVSALFKEHLFEIVALAVVFSPVFFMALPLGYIALRDIAKDQVDAALAYEKITFAEKATGSENISSDPKEAASDYIQSNYKKYQKLFKENTTQVTSIAVSLQNDKSVYKEKNTTEIWKDLIKIESEKHKKLSEQDKKLIQEFNETKKTTSISDVDKKINDSIYSTETIEHNTQIDPEDEHKTSEKHQNHPPLIKQLSRDNSNPANYTIINSDPKTPSPIHRTKIEENATTKEKNELFHEHLDDLFILVNNISSDKKLNNEKKQKLNDIIMQSITQNYISPLTNTLNVIMRNLNLTDKDDNQLLFFTATDSSEVYNRYEYNQEKNELIITVNFEFKVISSDNELMNVKVKQTSQLVIDLTNVDAEHPWKTMDVSIEPCI